MRWISIWRAASWEAEAAGEVLYKNRDPKNFILNVFRSNSSSQFWKVDSGSVDPVTPKLHLPRPLKDLLILLPQFQPDPPVHSQLYRHLQHLAVVPPILLRQSRPTVSNAPEKSATTPPIWLKTITSLCALVEFRRSVFPKKMPFCCCWILPISAVNVRSLIAIPISSVVKATRSKFVITKEVVKTLKFAFLTAPWKPIEKGTVTIVVNACQSRHPTSAKEVETETLEWKTIKSKERSSHSPFTISPIFYIQRISIR